MVGLILLDVLEVAAVRRVGAALNQVIDEVGGNQPSLNYVSSPRWKEVIESARAAFQLLRPRLQSEGDTILPPELPTGVQ